MQTEKTFDSLTLDRILAEIERTERLTRDLAPPHRTEAEDHLTALKKEKQRREKPDAKH